jgi:hypothetical protein
MSLNKETTVDKIEIVENGIIQVRQVTRIIEDGNELSKSYHCWMISPGQDYSDQPENVKAICAAAHTPAVIAAYEAQVQASRNLG